MSLRELTWTLSAKDTLSGAVKKIDGQVDKIKKNLPKLSKSIQTGLDGISKKSKKVSDSLGSMAKSTRGLSMGAAAVAGVGIKTAIDFEEKLNFAGVQADMTAQEVDELGKSIRNMEKRSTSVELLDAAGVYASAGLIKDEIIGVMQATEQLTRITKDSGVASDIMLTAGVAFDLDLTDKEAVQSMGDKFAKGSSLAKLEMEQINETTKIAQGTFKSMNMTADDAISSITLLAKAGYVGSSAGTMMNAAYNDLISKSEEGQLEIGKFSMSLYDAAGQMKTMPQIMSEIEKGTANMSEEQRNAALANTFGANSQKMVNAFLDQGSEAYQSYSNSVMNAEGDLQAKYDETGKTRAEQWAKAKSSLLDVVGTLGDAMMPAIDSTIGLIERFSNWFGSLDEDSQKFIGSTILGTAALSPLLSIGSKVFGVFSSATGGLGKFIKVIPKLGEKVGGIAGVGKKLSSAGSLIMSMGGKLLAGGKLLITTAGGLMGKAAAFVAANPIVLGIAATIAAGVLLYKNWDAVKQKAGELKESLSNAWSKISSDASASWNRIKDDTIEKFTTMTTNVKNKWTSLKTNLKESAKAKVDLLKDKFDSGVKWVKDKWQGLKDFFRHPIQGTVGIAKKAVGKAKDFVTGNYAVGATNIQRDHIAQVHQGETILPKSLAREYRARGGTRHRLPNTSNNSQVNTQNFNPTINVNISGDGNGQDIAAVVRRELELMFKKLNMQY